jgi:hypothetical protein
VERPQEEGTEDGDSVCSDSEEAGADWSLLNMTMVVGYLSSTELLLSHVESEESCLEAIRQCIRQLGTEQDTHTLVLMKVMFDCVRLCDDAGAVLAAFPAENLLLGAVCGVLLYCACSQGALADRNLSALENYNFELVDGVKLKKEKINAQSNYSSEA